MTLHLQRPGDEPTVQVSTVALRISRGAPPPQHSPHKHTHPFGRPHRLGLPMVVVICVECLPAYKLGCGVCDTPEHWRGAAGLMCARVRACAGAAESLHVHTHTYIPPPNQTAYTPPRLGEGIHSRPRKYTIDDPAPPAPGRRPQRGSPVLFLRAMSMYLYPIVIVGRAQTAVHSAFF